MWSFPKGYVMGWEFQNGKTKSSDAKLSLFSMLSIKVMRCFCFLVMPGTRPPKRNELPDQSLIYPPWNQHFRTWKSMVLYFPVRTVSFRESISKTHQIVIYVKKQPDWPAGLVACWSSIVQQHSSMVVVLGPKMHSSCWRQNLRSPWFLRQNVGDLEISDATVILNWLMTAVTSVDSSG